MAPRKKKSEGPTQKQQQQQQHQDEDSDPDSIAAYEALPIERRTNLISRFGTLHAAKAEVDTRRADHADEYEETFALAEQSRMAFQHLTTRNKIWDDTIRRNEEEMAKCLERIGELEGMNGRIEGLRGKLEEELRELAGRWDGDSRVMGLWEAFFELDIDEGELQEGLRGLDEGDGDGVEGGGMEIDENGEGDEGVMNS